MKKRHEEAEPKEVVGNARGKTSTLTLFPHLRTDPQPASWSILRRSIPRLFRLDALVLKSIFCAADKCCASILELPDEEWAKLGRAAVYKDDALYAVLALSVAYLLELRVSRRTFDSIVDAFEMLCDQFGMPNASLEVSEASEIFADTDIAKISRFRIDSFNVPHECADELGRRGLTLWRDLPNKTEKGILEALGLTWDSVKLIYLLWQAKAYAGGITTEIPDCGWQGTFAKMVSDFVASEASKDRDKTVMLGRLGLLDGRKWTLDELGRRFGITREGVRQVEARLLRRLRRPSKLRELALFGWAVEETLRVRGGVCLSAELKQGVTEKLQWEQELNEQAFTSFAKLFAGIEVEESGLAYDPSHECTRCDRVVYALNSIFSEDKSERSISEVAGFLLSLCAGIEACGHDAKDLAFSDGFVSFQAEKTQDVLVEEDMVYSRTTWSSRYGTRVQFVESILRNAARPMHLNEVYERARALLPNDDKVTERNVYSWLGRAENLVLWKEGTFVHCDSVPVSSGFVRDIETFLVKRLSGGLPFLCIKTAFDIFEKRCRESNLVEAWS